MCVMNLSEKNIEDFIFNLSKDELRQRGLRFYSDGKMRRQVKLGNYGICDLLKYDVSYLRDSGHRIFIDLVELKKGTAGLAALNQLCRYINGILDFISEDSKRNNYLSDRIIFSAKLIAHDFEFNSDMTYIIEAISMNYNNKGFKPIIDFYEYNIDFSTGIQFQGVSPDFGNKKFEIYG